jgi:hypothetical protein
MSAITDHGPARKTESATIVRISRPDKLRGAQGRDSRLESSLRRNEQLAGPANAARRFGRVDETMARLLHVARFADALAPTHR